MPNIRNTFLAGKMNLDSDSRLLQPEDYRRAENIRVINSEGSEVGTIEKTLSNKEITSLSLGENAVTLESIADEFDDKIYWAVKSELGCYILEYDKTTNSAVKVLEDERLGVSNILNFSTTLLLQMVLIVDSDNGNRFLGFTDNNTQPKLINVDRAKTYGLNGFTESMILLIKAPPLFPPEITLQDVDSDENTISERFITIGYRFKYLDDMYSAISPQSEIAFNGKTFSYKFATSSNESMINNFDAIDISFNTGSGQVTDVELIYKESGSQNTYIIESFNKTEKGWPDNSNQTFRFSNNKIYKSLPVDELLRLYDNVPLRAKAIAVIRNRIVFGNYSENYNLKLSDDSPMPTNYSLQKIQTAIPSGTPTQSLKTIRDYEIARVYLDDYGRMTTALTSQTNTIKFNLDECITQNQIKVIMPIESKAPRFAKYCRFYIKENKRDYETIIPTLFFFESNFIYFYIQSADQDKIKEGEFLIVKSDTEGIKDKVIKLKVVEVERKDKDFISEENGGQPEGVYLKTSIQNIDVRFDENSYNFYEFDDYDQSENSDRIIGEETNYTESVFKGDTLDDLTPTSDFSNLVDTRYEIEITSVTTVDKFRFRTQQTDGTFSNWDDNLGLGYDITGALQIIDSNLSITFTSTTGHGLLDKWLVKVNKAFLPDENNYSIAAYSFNDTITLGSLITLKYYSKQENSSDIDRFTLNLISNNDYQNLEEWYYGDEIYTQIAAETEFDQTLDKFWFRKTTNTSSAFGINNFTVLQGAEFTTLFIQSRRSSKNSSRDVYSDSFIEIRKLDQLPIFEKEIGPETDNIDIFYEIPRTYVIDVNGNHIAHDGNDITQTDIVNGEFVLPVFNCISWGNGFESYKIRDEFNAKTMALDTRPITPIENYQENTRIASLTYSGVFEQTTSYNSLNEFNLSLANFKDLDDVYGEIQRLLGWNTDLDVYQDDKVTKVYYDKQVLYNRDGTSNLASTDDLFSGTVPYTGEFGISTNAQSLVKFGNYTYWTDWKRGVVLRKGRSGIEVISAFGMRDYFRDSFTNNKNINIRGGYDSYFGQYVLSVNGETLTFDEKVKGWTSFHSFVPESMVRLNNRFYSFKDGQLWQHNDETSYNSYYGNQVTSKITTVFNQEMMYDKIFKTIVLEGELPWDIDIATNYTKGALIKSNFSQKESRWFAYLRQNETVEDLNSSAYGIGAILSYIDRVISFNNISESVSTGDSLYQVNGSKKQLIGIIESHNKNSITVASIQNTPVTNLFAYTKKNSRIEGGKIRGYYAEVTLSDSADSKNALFAVNANAVPSFVSN
ncbi:hypothetical protein [Olleya marilimosa]|uniref:hypothetical protein n=1 Tax=Olleya marilimosa TaxID=272164 RepID=UPI0030ECBA45|tara:strand:- start:1253 stop:5140 length:3888 start_codon:yes stop_codon:yes gene_type:complete